MTALSHSVALAWKIAASEAMQVHAENIEKEHLLIGIFSLEKALSMKDLKDNPKAARIVLDEKDSLDYLLRNSCLDAMTLRRRLRQSLERGGSVRKKGTIHRSPACRQVFERATRLASGKVVNTISLFHAILEDPGPVILAALDMALPQSNKVGGAVSVSLQMTRSITEYQQAQDLKEYLRDGIVDSRHTLSSLHKESDAYKKLVLELFSKTLLLARTCLDYGDGSRLIFALRGLEPGAGDKREKLKAVIGQLEFVHAEGISLGEPSKQQIRDLLQELEMQGCRGRA